MFNYVYNFFFVCREIRFLCLSLLMLPAGFCSLLYLGLMLMIYRKWEGLLGTRGMSAIIWKSQGKGKQFECCSIFIFFFFLLNDSCRALLFCTGIGTHSTKVFFCFFNEDPVKSIRSKDSRVVVYKCFPLFFIFFLPCVLFLATNSSSHLFTFYWKRRTVIYSASFARAELNDEIYLPF